MRNIALTDIALTCSLTHSYRQCVCMSALRVLESIKMRRQNVNSAPQREYILTFAPRPLNICTNKSPASSPSSVLTSRNTVQSFLTPNVPSPFSAFSPFLLEDTWPPSPPFTLFNAPGALLGPVIARSRALERRGPTFVPDEATSG